MKTIRKKYIRKRKTTKKRTRKNGYFLKGGDKKESEVEEEKGGEEQETADKKGGEVEEENPGEVIVDSEGNQWTFKEDPTLGPIYYSVWTIRGEPIYVWTADKFAFLKGDLKTKIINFFMSVNPTAIMMKTAADSMLNILKENKDKIQDLKQMFSMPTNISGVNIAGANMGAFSGANMVTAPTNGGGKRKRRKFTKRCK